MLEQPKPAELSKEQKELASLYHRVFVGSKEGEKVLEDLVARFYDRPVYVPGGEEAQRETEKRAAENNVIGFILKLVGQVQ